MLDYLRRDFDTCKGNHGKAILKLIGDLYSVMNAGNDIRLVRERGGVREEIGLSPLEIIYEGGYFYLVGALDFCPDRVEKIRLDQIDSFLVRGTYYAKAMQNQYEEEKRNDKKGEVSA